ncbi:MAG TPA: hypothetical protein VEF53_18705 [Patescibacteria group bacterium]|nr:hypothetical protein [Patescibacteria group bacterium]
MKTLKAIKVGSVPVVFFMLIACIPMMAICSITLFRMGYIEGGILNSIIAIGSFLYVSYKIGE